MRIQWAILGMKVSNPKTLGAGHEQFGICLHQSQHCLYHLEMPTPGRSGGPSHTGQVMYYSPLLIKIRFL